MTKFDLFNGDVRVDYMSRAKLNTDSGMIYFVFFDGEAGLDPGRYFLELSTKSGLNLKTSSVLEVGHRDTVELSKIEY